MDDDVRAFVIRTAEERGIRFIRLWFTDILGSLNMFAITGGGAAGDAERGRRLRWLGDRRVRPRAESDMVANPDPSTFQLLPWRPERRAWPACSATSGRPRAPFPGDPRPVLRAQPARRGLGLSFYVGPEVEYFLFRDSDTPSPSTTARTST